MSSSWLPIIVDRSEKGPYMRETDYDLALAKSAAVAREMLRQAGRPGMHINDIAVPLTCAGKMATVDFETGLHPPDGLLVAQLPELKTNYNQLSRVAAGAVACAMCGVHQMGVGATGGSQTDHTSGLEARFNAEVVHAAISYTRDEANTFVLEFLSRYEEIIDNPNPDKPSPEIYDTGSLEPTQEWWDCYHEVRQEIIEMDLDLDRGWRKVRLGD